MAKKFAIKMDLKLQKLSIISIATNLWGSFVARKKIREFFANAPLKLENFSKVVDQMLQLVRKLLLPEKLLVKIQDVIPFIGEKVFWWTLRVKSNLAHCGTISWTCHGTIDEVKTFKLFWENNPKLFPHPGNAEIKFLNSVYGCACVLGQEDFVSRNITEMKKMLNIPEHLITTNLLIGISICCFIKKDVTSGYVFYNELKRSGNLDAKLRAICAQAGYSNAFKYFFKNRNDKINDTEKRDIAFSILVSLRGISSGSKRKSDNHVEILIFLIKNMSAKSRKLFFRSNLNDLFSLFIDFWPYQEFAWQIVFHALPLKKEDDQKKFLLSIANYFLPEHNRHPTCKNIARQVLEKVLKSTSKEIKMSLIDSDYVCRNLKKKTDFWTLKLILNDPDVATYKNQIFAGRAREIFKLWIKQADFDRLNEFMNEVLSDGEKKKFKSDLNIVRELVMEAKFALADKLLDWLADSAEEKLLLKGEINPVGMLRFYLQTGKFSLRIVNELLMWRFDGDEEKIKQIKVSIATEGFIRSEFYKIWGSHCSSVETSKTKCSEFLNFFVDPNETETFKREVIIQDEEFLRFFCEKLWRPRHFNTVDEFLRFCSLSQNEIDKLKEKVLKDIKRWIKHFGKQEKSFKLAFLIVSWVTEGKENKKGVIEKFVNSCESTNFKFYVAICAILNSLKIL